MRLNLRACLVVLLSILAACALAFGSNEQPWASLLTSDPGASFAKLEGTRFSVSNHALNVEWSIAGGKLRFTRFDDHFGNKTLPVPHELFVIRLRDGREIRASKMALESQPAVK